jgi:outer membrane lipoprotein LolB
MSGCAALQQQTAVKTIFTEPVADIQNVKADPFNLLGRISIQNGHERHSGSIRWQHTDINDEILLSSPFGQIVAQIWQDQDGARLITSKQEIFYAPDMENLTAEILGWRLPLNGLQYWIQGHHSPYTASAKDINHEDRVITIRQDDWRIHYNRFFPDKAEQITRPRMLELNYQDLKIRVVVDNWENTD